MDNSGVDDASEKKAKHTAFVDDFFRVYCGYEFFGREIGLVHIAGLSPSGANNWLFSEPVE